MKYKAAFLDQNGTLTPELHYGIARELELSDEIVEGLQRLQSNGYLLIIVSHQPGVAHGFCTAADVEQAKNLLYASCARPGIYLDGFYYCPHDPHGVVPEYNTDCDCRKPQPGLLLKASRDLGIDLSQSWMVGHILNDVEAGNRAGCKSVMINDGSEKTWVSGAYRFPEYFASDLAEASKYIVGADKMRKVEEPLEIIRT